LRGGRLATLEQSVDQYPEQFGPLEREFLQASRALATRELKATRESRRRLRRARLIAAAQTLLLVAASVLGVLAWTSSVNARAAWDLASAREWAAQADRMVGTRSDLAILLGLQGLSLARGQDQAPPPGLITGLAQLTHRTRELLGGHDGAVFDAAFSPDGALLATAGADGAVRLWDVGTGQPHGAPLTGHDGTVWSVAFSPDGDLLASAGTDGTVRLWETATGQPHGAPLTGHTGPVTAVAFSPDGDLLASASTDSTVRLWDPATGRPHGEPLEHSGAVRSMAISRAGALLVSTGTDPTVQLWNLRWWDRPSSAWAKAGCGIVNRNLSRDEWDQLAGGLPYQRTCPALPAGGAPDDAPDAQYTP
jgi:WD40 repeat protein